MAKLTLNEAYHGALGRIRHIRDSMSRKASDMATGTTASSVVISIQGDLWRERQLLQTYASVAGIGAYAQEQFNDPALNVSAEFNAMMTALDAVRSWIRTNFPTVTQQGTAYGAARTWDANNNFIDRQFAADDLADLKMALDNLVASTDWVE